MDIFTCMTNSLCCITETNTTLWIKYTPIKLNNRIKKKNPTIWSSKPTSTYLSKRTEIRIVKRYQHLEPSEQGFTEKTNSSQGGSLSVWNDHLLLRCKERLGDWFKDKDIAISLVKREKSFCRSFNLKTVGQAKILKSCIALHTWTWHQLFCSWLL